MTRFLFALIFCTSLVPSRAEDHTDFSSLRTILQGHTVVTGKFTQERTIEAIENPIVSTGDFVFLRERGIYWHTMEPVEFKTSFMKSSSSKKGSDANTDDSNPPKNKPSPMQNKIGELLVDFLGGNLTHLEKKFHLAWRVDGSAWNLSLIPRKRAVKKQLAELFIEGSDYIKHIKIVTKNSGITSIQFNEVQQKDDLTPEECLLILPHLGIPLSCNGQG